jgi:ADYC domain-containing protein
MSDYIITALAYAPWASRASWFRVTYFVAALLALAFEGRASAAERIDTVGVDGTALRVALSNGQVLQGTALAGATLSIVLANDPNPRRIKIRTIVPDPTDPDGEVLLYRMGVVDPVTGALDELCEPDARGERWAFPLKGQWDTNGRRISDEGFTLTCSAGAQGKCVRFGYKPWKVTPDGIGLADYHQACVRLVRADYCGNQGTTRDGMLIDIYDRLGIQRPTEDAEQRGLRFEAAWNPDGAVCVAHTRVPANMTLAHLGEVCSRLRGHLGDAECTAEAAASGRLGPSLLFNRSR